MIRKAGFWLLFGVGSEARSASRSGPSRSAATHCIDELIVRPTRVTVGSRLGVKSQAYLHCVGGCEGRKA
jgi:hypothetical protein